VKYWEIISENLKKAGWSLGWASALDAEGRTIWIVDAHRGGKRFVVRADEKLSAFVELQRAIHEFAVSLIS
jgi:SH3-like domain-containing protein